MLEDGISQREEIQYIEIHSHMLPANSVLFHGGSGIPVSHYDRETFPVGAHSRDRPISSPLIPRSLTISPYLLAIP